MAVGTGSKSTFRKEGSERGADVAEVGPCWGGEGDRGLGDGEAQEVPRDSDL